MKGWKRTCLSLHIDDVQSKDENLNALISPYGSQRKQH